MIKRINGGQAGEVQHGTHLSCEDFTHRCSLGQGKESTSM